MPDATLGTPSPFGQSTGRSSTTGLNDPKAQQRSASASRVIRAAFGGPQGIAYCDDECVPGVAISIRDELPKTSRPESGTSGPCNGGTGHRQVHGSECGRRTTRGGSPSSRLGDEWSSPIRRDPSSTRCDGPSRSPGCRVVDPKRVGESATTTRVISGT